MDYKFVTNETRTFYSKAISGQKFKENEFWGIKDETGEIILEPMYDTIEFCTDFIYVHYDDRHMFLYKNGVSRDCADSDDDYRFYQDGYIGLIKPDGSVLLPAIYDDIIDWGGNCDVVYARRGNEFHYYNHNKEEILTEFEDIPEDKCPVYPYSLGEDQNRHVMVCVEPIKKAETNRDCFAYGQWVRLSRIRYSSIRDIFTGCAVADIPESEINHFEDNATYIYSARTCTATGNKPIIKCLKKFDSLGCYNSDWMYLVKISTNRNTQLDPVELYEATRRFKFETHFAVDYDDQLQDGEVRVFQVHYFWDDMGAYLYDDLKQKIMPHGTLAEIKQSLESKDEHKKKEFLREAFEWVEYSKDRSWEETKSILDYFKGQGSDVNKMLSQIMNFFCIEKFTPGEWKYRRKVVEWAISNGAQLNRILSDSTHFDNLRWGIKCLKERDAKSKKALNNIKNAESFAKWFKEQGGVTARVQRQRIINELKNCSPNDAVKLLRNFSSCF